MMVDGLNSAPARSGTSQSESSFALNNFLKMVVSSKSKLESTFVLGTANIKFLNF